VSYLRTGGEWDVAASDCTCFSHYHPAGLRRHALA
jgi:hypothetical protein